MHLGWCINCLYGFLQNLISWWSFNRERWFWGKFILKQQMPQVKSDCHWTCCFQDADSTFVFLLKRPPACSSFRERYLTREKLEPRRNKPPAVEFKACNYILFNANILLLCLGNWCLRLVSTLGWYLYSLVSPTFRPISAHIVECVTVCCLLLSSHIVTFHCCVDCAHITDYRKWVPTPIGIRVFFEAENWEGYLRNLP